MAISIYSDQARLAVAVKWACDTHGYAHKAFIRAERDHLTGDIRLLFKPTRQSHEIVALANALHRMMNDEFRGEVLRAAVPELARVSVALADAILNPKAQIVTLDYALLGSLLK